MNKTVRLVNDKCNCTNSTGSTRIECCNICGLPLKKETWHCFVPDDTKQSIIRLIDEVYSMLNEKQIEYGKKEYFNLLEVIVAQKIIVGELKQKIKEMG